tara:strand:+ start:260 stop:439 length:180 start_codon:yes stop_codon:yes gene_type:complete
MSHNSLENYYVLTFALMQHHKYSLTEIENMMPYERDIYTQMLENHIQEENERMKRESNR